MMSTANIRITAEGGSTPAGGIVGALGGANPGASQTVEIDLSDLSGGDVAAVLPLVAEAYRTSFFGERVEQGVLSEIPFPEAGDPHPFPEEAQPEPSQVGTDLTFEARVARLRNTAASFPINSMDELRALPPKSHVVDKDGDVWAASSGSLAWKYAPLTVIHIPATEDE